MGATAAPSAAVALIAAMITPALLLLGSASLVASALVRMARVVDRARVLIAAGQQGGLMALGVPPGELRGVLLRHALRARYAERSIMLLYAAIVVFISTCLAIGLDRASGEAFGLLPVALAVAGMLLLLAGGGYMVAESRLRGAQIDAEIRFALARLPAPGSAEIEQPPP